MQFLKGKRTNIFIDDYCRPAKVFSWRFSMICSFYTFMEKGVGFFIPVYPLVFHHKKSLILTFYCFCQDGILRFHHKSQSGLMEGANFYVQARRFFIQNLGQFKLLQPLGWLYRSICVLSMQIFISKYKVCTLFKIFTLNCQILQDFNSFDNLKAWKI